VHGSKKEAGLAAPYRKLLMIDTEQNWRQKKYRKTRFTKAMLGKVMKVKTQKSKLSYYLGHPMMLDRLNIAKFTKD